MYYPPINIDKDWIGIKSVIKVERKREYKKKKEKEVSYYISSISAAEKPSKFYKIIRGHWEIENSLHYIKDKTLREDACKVTSNGAKNLSIVRNIILITFRKKGFSNMAQAIRLMANNVNKMWAIFRE